MGNGRNVDPVYAVYGNRITLALINTGRRSTFRAKQCCSSYLQRASLCYSQALVSSIHNCTNHLHSFRRQNKIDDRHCYAEQIKGADPPLSSAATSALEDQCYPIVKIRACYQDIRGYIFLTIHFNSSHARSTLSLTTK